MENQRLFSSKSNPSNCCNKADSCHSNEGKSSTSFQYIDQKPQYKLPKKNNLQKYDEPDAKSEPDHDIPYLDELMNENADNSELGLRGIENKDGKWVALLEEANLKFGKDKIDYILSLYEECQKNSYNNGSDELDKAILESCNGDYISYCSFLEIFYKIVYLKYLQEIEENVILENNKFL